MDIKCAGTFGSQAQLMRIPVVLLALLFFANQLVFSEEFALTPSSHSWGNCVVYSDGNALYAVSRTNLQPLWSESGLFYRETVDFDDLAFAAEVAKKKRTRPTQMFAEHYVRDGRLYVVLNRSAFGPEKGNVLAAFDLTQEGKILWRIALDEKQYSQKLRFAVIDSLIENQLTVFLSDDSVLRVDAITGAVDQ